MTNIFYLYGVERLKDIKFLIKERIEKSQILLNKLLKDPVEAQDEDRIIEIYRNIKKMQEILKTEESLNEENC